jgi:hypothetical protein
VILKGSQRSGARHLAAHLLNDRDNDHVAVIGMRGFVADDLHGALLEAQAIAKGTQCKQYLFSLSLNPPQDAVASEMDFERAADEAEERLGLAGQPRAIILHEKEGRRHAHVVWSRIDAEKMRAVNLAHFKNKLTALSRELYLEHGWPLPDGLRQNGGKSPLNFTLPEWQQAKRLGLDPREIKSVFREAWTQSDNAKAFAAALEERGYFVAKGDRRGFVALDVEGCVYSIPTYLGIKTSAVRQKLGDGNALPSVSERQDALQTKVADKLRGFVREAREVQARDLQPLMLRRDELRAQHRAERAQLHEKQAAHVLHGAARWRAEADARAQRLRTGFAGLWDKISGKAKLIRQENQREALGSVTRDRRQRDRLAVDQMQERAALQERLLKLRRRHIDERRALNRDLIKALKSRADTDAFDRLDEAGRTHSRARKRGFSLDPS